MEPVFTMQYAEFKVANCLAEKISDASVFIPASAQEKGIDLLLYRHCDGRNTTNTVQVKMSRTYYSKKAADEYPYYLWFNRFGVPENADKMFGFGFDDEEHIVQTRGYATKRDMSAYLLKNRLAEIGNSFR